MKRIFHIFLVLAISILGIPFSACDKVDDPYPTINEIDSSLVWDDSVEATPNNGVRFILMEEFTGFRCPNCPEGAERVEDLIADYGDRFIAVAIHAQDEFAKPIAESGPYSNDYRTEDGNIYNETFQIASLPAGMVSRIQRSPGNYSMGRNLWRNFTEDIIANPGVTLGDINIKNLYDDSSRTMETRVSFTWLEDNVTSNYNLQLYLLENDIIDWQIDNRKDPSDIENYVHKHLFRGSLNTTWGHEISFEGVGTTVELDPIQKQIPDGWKTEDLVVVAFVYDSDTYEVKQANEAHITP